MIWIEFSAIKNQTEYVYILPFPHPLFMLNHSCLLFPFIAHAIASLAPVVSVSKFPNSPLSPLAPLAAAWSIHAVLKGSRTPIFPVAPIFIRTLKVFLVPPGFRFRPSWAKKERKRKMNPRRRRLSKFSGAVAGSVWFCVILHWQRVPPELLHLALAFWSMDRVCTCWQAEEKAFSALH